jgi:hypothetical protein
MTQDSISAVESAVSSGYLRSASRFNALRTAHITAKRADGFTLAELLVTFGVLIVLMLLFTQLFNNAATVTTLGNKRMDADSQARQLLDRMAIDFAQMVKRPDVDYYLKSPANPQTGGNDQIAFYSNVPGYYLSSGSQSPVSLVAYRINSVIGTAAVNKMERLGKGLVWNGVSSTDNPVVFLPLTISGNWSYATNANSDAGYEIMGSQVFRFEYYYLLKGQVVNTTTYNAIFSNTPWDTRIAGHTTVNGMGDVAAIVADIAVVDPKSRGLLTDAQVTTLAGTLSNYGGQAPGVLLSTWRNAIDANTNLPRAALSSIRLYERYLYLSPPTPGTL